MKNKKIVLVMFGGISAEHEVSVITGLQVLEKIDRNLYEPHVIYHTKKGELLYLGGLKDKKDFLTVKRSNVVFGKDDKGPFVQPIGLIKKKIYPDCAYLAFHGGTGESGQIQGFLEILEIPYTSPNVEASAITMNKELTKEVLRDSGVPFLEGISVFSSEVKKDVKSVVARVIKVCPLPVIVKPVHLGSSIGIGVAKTDVQLEKSLLESAQIDNEILIERFLSDFKEYNVAVRLVSKKAASQSVSADMAGAQDINEAEIETSEIERPFSKDEILSFADKYLRGGGKKIGAGMASLSRELPAKIDDSLRQKLVEYAKKAFVACRCKGMIRVDFMVTAKGEIYLTEINPIPGSMAYFLWEAKGIEFTRQISDLIEQAIIDFHEAKARRLEYKSDIVERYIKA